MRGRSAILVSIGEEVIGGDIVDSNAAEISRRLKEVGIAVRGFRAVGDVEADIAAAFLDAAQRAAIVVSTGGLGPTRDDLTRDGLARALGDELVEDPEALSQIEAIFARNQRPMSESNRLQALRPRGAELLKNPVGTAPGVFAKLRGAVVFLLPGVPFEMKRMFDDEVLPRLRELGFAHATPPMRKLRCHGIPESVAGERIAEFMGEDKDPYVGITVSGGIITVKATARRASPADSARVDFVIGEIEKRLGSDVFGHGDTTLERAVIELARKGSRRIATAESCTGGRIAAALTSIAGSSDVFIGGVVAYANEVKEQIVGVDPNLIAAHGAVSAEVAKAMASGVATRLGADIAVSVTGIAGPGGGTATKPVGLVHVGVYDRGHVDSKELRFVGDREAVQLRAARVALDLLRRALSSSSSQ